MPTPNSAAGVDITQTAGALALSPEVSAQPKPKHPWQKQLAAIFHAGDYLHILLIHGTETFTGRDGKPHPKTQEHWDSYEGVIAAESLDALQNWEQRGWNIFICIAVFDAEKIKAAQDTKQPRRVSANIATKDGKNIVRCVAIDCDADGKASLNKIGDAVKAGLVPTPTVVIRSSTPPTDRPDASPKFHVWWAVEGVTVEQQAALNAALQREFGGDPAAKDVVRVLRLAGFVNNQPKYPHKPVVELVRCNRARYAFEDFKLSVDVKPLGSVRAKASSDRLEFYCNQIETNAAEAGFDLGDAEPYLDGGFKWVQQECPNADAHTTGGRNGSFLILMPSGAKSFGCLHAHCKGEKDGTLLDWEWFKDHLNALAEKELDWTDKGMLIVPETSSVASKAETVAMKHEAEDVKETSLLVFTSVEDVAFAASDGYQAVLASDFALPLDSRFHRVVLCGSAYDDGLTQINAQMNAHGVTFLDWPPQGYPVRPEKSEWLAEKLRPTIYCDRRKQRMRWTEIPAEAEGSNATTYLLEFKHPAIPNPAFDFVVLGAGEKDGWFPLGDLSLIGGPSGGTKSTLIMDLLETQARSEDFLGQKTFGRSFLIVMADRGANAHERTAFRMRLKDETPIRFIPTQQGPPAIQNILRKIEECESIPQVVFVEGLDMLVEDANKMHIVSPFIQALNQIAAHYHIAIIGSVGSAKAKKGQEYVAMRDKIFGTIAWGRKTETIAVLQYVDGDDTSDKRALVVLLRNNRTEKYSLKMLGGRLVIDNTPPEAEDENIALVWFRAQGEKWFTRVDYQKIMKCKKARACDVIADAYAKRWLERKHRNQWEKGKAPEYRWNPRNTNPENDNYDPNAVDENEAQTETAEVKG